MAQISYVINVCVCVCVVLVRGGLHCCNYAKIFRPYFHRQ